MDVLQTVSFPGFHIHRIRSRLLIVCLALISASTFPIPASASLIVQSVFTEDGVGTPPGDSISIFNSSASSYQIDSITIDLTGTSENVAFDPEGTPVINPSITDIIGSTGFGSLVFGSSFFQTGLDTDRTVYQTLTLSFTDFDPGEQLLINLDLDPDLGGTTGGVVGNDMIGALLEVTYNLGDSAFGVFESTGLRTAEAEIRVSSVPEPNTVLLFLTGAGLFWVFLGVSRHSSQRTVAV